MFSKAWELTGAILIAVAIGCWATWEAGMLFGGLFLLATGSTLDDQAIGQRFHRGWHWLRYAYWRQVAREGDVPGVSPHPPIRVDPQAQAMADRLARMRQERAKVHDRTRALSRDDTSTA